MLAKFKLYLESIELTPTSWLLGVSGVLMARFFLESLSSPTSTGLFSSDASTLVHYYLFFMSVFVTFMVVFLFLLPEWKHISAQFMAISSVAVFIAPILDWIISGGRGLKMVYFFDAPKEILFSFLNFGSIGTTTGLRIEIALMLLSFGVLIYLVKKSFLKAITSSLILYIIIFLFASITSIIAIIGQVGDLIPSTPLIFLQDSIFNSETVTNNLHGALKYSSSIRQIEIAFNFIMGKILFMILVAASFFWFYLNFKNKFKAVISNSRFERVAHYLILVSLGAMIAHSLFPDVSLNWNDWLSVMVLFLSFYFAIMFLVGVNDVADEKIDKISNASRPLVAGDLSRREMRQVSMLFLVASLIAAFLAGYTAFFFVLAFAAIYYVYSAPPTRFKIIPFFSSFLISLCCLLATMAGFFLVAPIKQVTAFPVSLIVAIVIIFFLGVHIRDLKDIKGDRAAGIKTVPVIFGDTWGPRVVGLMSSLAYLLVPVFLNFYFLFLIAFPGALANYYLCARKPYSEKPIFMIYFAFVVASLLLLLS